MFEDFISPMNSPKGSLRVAGHISLIIQQLNLKTTYMKGPSNLPADKDTFRSCISVSLPTLCLSFLSEFDGVGTDKKKQNLNTGL